MNITDQDPAADRLQPISRPLRPLNDRILVRRLEEGENFNLIICPEISQVPSKQGIVVAVGPGKRDAKGFRRPLSVKPGDWIQFGRYTDYDDSRLVIIQEADVVGILENQEGQ